MKISLGYFLGSDGNTYQVIQISKEIKFKPLSGPNQVHEGFKSYATSTGEALNMCGENFATLDGVILKPIK